MLFSKSKRLLRRYGEVRIYATEVQFHPDGTPQTIYLFLTEYNTEIQIQVASIEKVIKSRSKQETLTLIRTHTNDMVLLVLDDRRGNHYVYCQNSVYQAMLGLHTEHASLSLSHTSGAPASDHFAIQKKVLVIDADVLGNSPDLLPQWIEHNEIIVSPYYDMELERYVPSLLERKRIISLVENLAGRYPGKLMRDLYADSKGISADLSNENEYLLLLASQQHLSVSQVVIVTASEDLTVKASIQGYTVLNPLTASKPQATKPIERTTVTAAEQESAAAQSGEELPPRSMRHRKKNDRSIFHTIHSLFTLIM